MDADQPDVSGGARSPGRLDVGGFLSSLRPKVECPISRLSLALAWFIGSFNILVIAQEHFTPDHIEFFEKQIRPLLSERCYSCHSAGAEKLKGGLRVDSRDGLLKGGDTGAAIVPGSPAKSLLIKAVHYQDIDLKMPPKNRLADNQIRALEQWIEMGAPWPKEVVQTASKKESFNLEQRRQSHWAWSDVPPRRRPNNPSPSRAPSPIDEWIELRHRQLGLQAAPRAGKSVLLRRLSMDLTGIPPQPSELESFLTDHSEQALERRVDRLLASPHFGERWARHWLDLARYAETLGHEFDYPQYNAWRYRDYLVRALNQDLPYPQLVTEHIAGDQMSPARRHPVERFNESILGTSIYWLGQREHSPVDVRIHQAEVVDNQIDVITKSFLGVTVACARCHDHKFDAISTKDYYALYGILGSSRYTQVSIDEPSLNRPTISKLAESKRAFRAETARAWIEKLEQLPASELNQLAKADDPVHFRPPLRAGELEFADFSAGSLESWFPEGEAFASPFAKPGDFIPGTAKRPVSHLVTKAQVHSGVAGKRLQGALRSPTFQLTHPYIHILAAGRGTRVSLPVHNFTMIRDPIYGALRKSIASDAPRWITMSVGMWKGTQGYLEFCDHTTPDLADDIVKERVSPEGWLALHRIVFSNESSPPASGPAFPHQPLPEALRPQLIAAARNWGLPGEVGVPDLPGLAIALDRGLLDLDPASPASARLQAQLSDIARLETRILEPQRASALVEGTGLDEKVFIRGNPKTPGEPVSRRFLEALGGTSKASFSRGSGRLELARQITDQSNPLFSRVLVNRVWLHLFGRGIVPTPDDFGVLGQPPSHPELLDWLADWFRTEGGWSIKRLIRLMVLTETYQHSSSIHDADTERKDPSNLHWHRMPIKRLQGEVIRDSMLAHSRRLDRTMFGQPVPIHLTEFMDGRGRPGKSGPLDGNGRRSLYIEVRRNFVSPMMRAFDTPVPFSTVGLRTVSNVPAQSLMMMNDPFVAEQAKGWAANVIQHGPATDRERIDRLYLEAFCRLPSDAERSGALKFLGEQRRGRDEKELWTDLCHVLFNVKEFIFIP